MPIKPGIYPDLPNKVYHADTALSNSMMGLFYKDPERLKAYLDDLTRKATNAMMFGSAYHCYILERHLFDNLFEVVPKGGYKITDKGITLIPESHGTSGGYNDILAMAEALKNDEAASNLLLSGGEAEVSYFWKSPKYGFMCKCRPDYRKGNILIDLKTTKDSSEEGFPWEIGNWGYHRQGAHYMHGVAANKIETENFAIIAQEKKPPYIVRNYRLKEEDLYLGHLENERIYEKYAACISTKVWKEPSKIRPISLPNKFVKNAKI